MKPVIKAILLTAALCHAAIGAEEKIQLPTEGLILDLDAAKDVSLEDGDRVVSWGNQAPGHADMVFVKRDEGRTPFGSVLAD